MFNLFNLFLSVFTYLRIEMVRIARYEITLQTVSESIRAVVPNLFGPLSKIVTLRGVVTPTVNFQKETM